MASEDIPNINAYAEGEAIPAVDPEDVKRLWKLKPPWGPGHDPQSECSPGADISAVSQRRHMIDTLNIFKLLTSWQHGEELDEAVFRIAATFPLRKLKYQPYKIPGDECFGFDPNVFVQQLIDETAISHVWEPVATKVLEGQRQWVSMSVNVPTPERDGKRQARQLIWDIWKRFAPSLDHLLSHRDTESASKLVATLFADFLMDNIDLVRQLESSFSSGKGPGGMDVLEELERKAQGWI